MDDTCYTGNERGKGGYKVRVLLAIKYDDNCIHNNYMRSMRAPPGGNIPHCAKKTHYDIAVSKELRLAMIHKAYNTTIRENSLKRFRQQRLTVPRNAARRGSQQRAATDHEANNKNQVIEYSLQTATPVAASEAHQ